MQCTRANDGKEVAHRFNRHLKLKNREYSPFETACATYCLCCVAVVATKNETGGGN